MPERTEDDFLAWVEGLRAQTDDELLAVAVATLVTRPAGPFGGRTHVALRAEVARRWLTGTLNRAIAAAIAQGRTTPEARPGEGAG